MKVILINSVCGLLLMGCNGNYNYGGYTSDGYQHQVNSGITNLGSLGKTPPSYFYKSRNNHSSSSFQPKQSRRGSSNSNFQFGGSKTPKGGKFLGSLNSNPYDPDSISNPYGKYGSKYSPDSVNNPYGKYGSKFSNQSANNPYATDAPKLYDSNGKYMGKLSSNKYDPDSTSNPYGRFGNKYSPDSINNKYGAGNPFSTSSPTNPYGSGFKIQTNTTNSRPSFYHNTNNNNFNSPNRPSFYRNPNTNTYRSNSLPSLPGLP